MNQVVITHLIGIFLQNLCAFFQAESEQFPGQFHHWILSRFLIKGKQKVEESYLCDLSRAAYLLGELLEIVFS